MTALASIWCWVMGVYSLVTSLSFTEDGVAIEYFGTIRREFDAEQLQYVVVGYDSGPLTVGSIRLLDWKTDLGFRFNDGSWIVLFDVWMSRARPALSRPTPLASFEAFMLATAVSDRPKGGPG